MNILHILNGDSTAVGFEDTGLEGDVMVWREVFSEGPLEEDVASARFWLSRKNWISQMANEPEDNYQQKVLDELVKLDEPYDEINLWFEFDLHCQANLIGLMSYMQQRTDLSTPSFFLICPSTYPGRSTFRGMGELNGEELEYLYDNIRAQLNGFDFIIAAEVWRIYASRDLERLTAYLQTNEFWGSLTLLKPAMEAQLGRLQYNNQNLDAVEQKLLAIYNNGAKTKSAIYEEFWATENIYGMSNLEIDIYLHRLESKSLINF